MKVRFSTGYLTKFLDVGSYGAEYSEWCEDSIQEIIPDVESATEDLMTNLFNEVIKETLCNDKKSEVEFELWNFKFHSPREYNCHNDTVDFDLYLDDYVRELILGFIEKEKYFDNKYGNFYEFVKENFKTSSGYINLCPETKDKFIESLYSEDDVEVSRALAEFITWIVGIDNHEYQEEFDYMMTDSEVYTKYILREEDEE